MPYLVRDHLVHIYYEVHGEGKPLILTHGYSSTSAMWHGQVDSFTEAGYQLLIWDMRGHGKSAYPDDQSQYSEAHTVSDILALLDHVCGAGSKAIVGGLSLGGYMSLAFNRVHPQRVRVLLIIDTGPGFKSDKAREAWNQTAHKTGSRFEKEGLSVLQADDVSPERSHVTHRNATGLALAARGMLAQRNAAVIESLPSVGVPALVVVGGEDTPFLMASEYMATRIPGAKKVVIPDAGHAVNIDQPKAFNEAVLGFLAEVERGSSGANSGRAML
ncbi:hypothetical protein LTR36_000448 [Oleoguttula mirabilis]|uniref:AB hydrolase-1 domain-containing protein n=1 Tax=Oleoguttula mirabilis TaxID=1507867 RepID=A0AAV9JZ53_9PEZI|nr:hypothetical protein LTR36_000448 [Oleoguttula mirabilis]